MHHTACIGDEIAAKGTAYPHHTLTPQIKVNGEIKSQILRRNRQSLFSLKTALTLERWWEGRSPAHVGLWVSNSFNK